MGFEPRSANPEPVLCVLHQSVLKDPRGVRVSLEGGLSCLPEQPRQGQMVTHAKLLGRYLVPNVDTAQADILMNFHH